MKQKKFELNLSITDREEVQIRFADEQTGDVAFSIDITGETAMNVGLGMVILASDLRSNATFRERVKREPEFRDLVRRIVDEAEGTPTILKLE